MITDRDKEIFPDFVLNKTGSVIQGDKEEQMDAPATDRIINQVQSGDVDAYAEIIRAWQDDIWRITSFALHDMETTEDLVQQTFVNAFFKLDSFEKGKDFGAWIRTIARNIVREELRRRSRHARRIDTYRRRLAKRFENSESADRHDSKLREALAECREKLSPPSARALDLRYSQSKGFDDIAALLGRTVAATRQMLQRVRLALRQCIEERMARE